MKEIEIPIGNDGGYIVNFICSPEVIKEDVNNELLFKCNIISIRAYVNNKLVVRCLLNKKHISKDITIGEKFTIRPILSVPYNEKIEVVINNLTNMKFSIIFQTLYFSNEENELLIHTNAFNI